MPRSECEYHGGYADSPFPAHAAKHGETVSIGETCGGVMRRPLNPVSGTRSAAPQQPFGALKSSTRYFNDSGRLPADPL